DELAAVRRRRPEYERKRRALLGEYRVPELQPDWENRVRAALTDPNAGARWRGQVDALTVQFDGGVDILRTEPARRTPKQRDRLTTHFVRWDQHAAPKKIKFPEFVPKLDKREGDYPELREARAMAERAEPPATHVLVRGDFLKPGDRVKPGTPGLLPGLKALGPPAGGSGRRATRLDLARWIVDPENPLTARVAVNRMWQEVFGRGPVATSAARGR